MSTLALLCALALAQPAKPPRVGTATESVVMLELGETAEQKRIEQRLFDELGLVLDDFGVIAKAPEDKSFATAPLAVQLESVFSMVGEEDVVAVVWLGRQPNGRLLLELVAQKTGRTLIRSVEGGKREATERSLALAVRELLATAFLFEPAQKQPKSVTALVDELKQQIAPAPTPPPAPEPVPEPAWRVRAELGTSIGVVGDLAQPVQWLGGVQASRRFGWLRAGVLADVAGTHGNLAGGEAVTWLRTSLAAQLMAERSAERLFLAAGVVLGGAWLHREGAGAAGSSTADAGAFRAEAVLEGGVRLFGDAWLTLSPAVGWYSHQLVGATSAGVTEASAKVAMRLTAGVEVRF